MAVLQARPRILGGRGPLSLGRIVLGTIEGDIHDIGKNLVGSMLSANGFDVIDLGADVKLDRFIEEAVAAAGGRDRPVRAPDDDDGSTSAGSSSGSQAEGLRSRFKVLVGGAPSSRAWAAEIGADGYGENAVAAVRAAEARRPRGPAMIPTLRPRRPSC